MKHMVATAQFPPEQDVLLVFVKRYDDKAKTAEYLTYDDGPKWVEYRGFDAIKPFLAFNGLQMTRGEVPLSETDLQRLVSAARTQRVWEQQQ